MQLSVIGCGYLGAVHAACMADLGHDVVGIDVDEAKIEALAAGRAPFHEPGFPEILERALESGRLRFTTDPTAAAGAQVHFICVGTPQLDGSDAADLQYVDAAVDSLLPLLRAEHEDGPVVVVGKSTVPSGTAERINAQITPTGARLVWNPEFLREGYGVKDTLYPDRIVYGVTQDESGKVAADVLDEVYADQLRRHIPRIITDMATAQLVKVAANAFLATKISFINAMAEICEVTGGDVTQLAVAIGHDDRIGKLFLKAGVGFGGGCLPKDIRAFAARAEELGRGDSVRFLREVDDINKRRRQRVVDLAVEALDGDVTGKKVAVLGASFKPMSDDLRDSPALDVARRLEALGAHVVITDPEALGNVTKAHPELAQAPDAFAAAKDAELVVLVTEWREYVVLDPEAFGQVVAARRVIDGRNVLDPAKWRAAGWDYRGLGRP